jgi:diguanylate cyclase (GGDEF)-like protein
MTLHVAVLTGGDALLRKLRDCCGEFSVSNQADAHSSIVITDDPAQSSLAGVTIVLSDSAPRRGEATVTITRSAFEADPASYLQMAAEIAELRAGAESARHLEELIREGDLDAACERVAKTALGRAQFSAATLLIHDADVERYVPAYSNEAGFTPSGEYLPGIPPDALQEAIKHPLHYAVQKKKGGGLVAILPLLLDEDLVGVLKMSSEEVVDAHLVEHAATYVRGVAPVIVRLHQLSKSKDLALRDDLTKAYNRRFFDTHLDEEVERARRYGAILSIIFLDLDDLKLVNNMYGHMAGSRLLQEVARRILGAVRNIDKVVRFGGDEFCIILPETDPDQASYVANRVRTALSQRPFVLEAGANIAMTASFGIASYPIHAHSKDELIRQADAAMYIVKSSSKNAINVATPQPASETQKQVKASQA